MRTERLLSWKPLEPRPVCDEHLVNVDLKIPSNGRSLDGWEMAGTPTARAERVPVSARAAVTGLKRYTFVPHSSGGWKPKAELPAEAASGEGSPLVLGGAVSQAEGASCLRAVGPPVTAPPSRSSHLPRAPAPSAIPLGARIST